MKNKGFTLVELLAVIAILAILVIVAMPNVLGMFNQAKVSSFVTEVQKIMDTATTTFTKDALINSGKTVYYSSTENVALKTKPLNMSGNQKNYFIEMDRNGNFKRVVVYDSNYCYDIHASGTNGKIDSSKSKMIIDEINKTSVVVGDVWESGNDSVGITMNGTNYVVNGCEALVTVEGKDTNVALDKVKIDGVEYSYVPGMTWEEWVNSEYNTLSIQIQGDIVVSSNKNLRTRMNFICDFDNNRQYNEEHAKNYHEIVKNIEYIFMEIGMEAGSGGPCDKGTYYYVYGAERKYITEKMQYN